MIAYYLIFLSIYLNAAKSDLSSSLQCKDEQGKNVDWFVAYKLPEKPEFNPLVNTGQSHIYITNNTVSPGFTLSNYRVGHEHSMIGTTLSPLYNQTVNQDLIWLLYNDHPPMGSAATNYGHSKGVLIANKIEGFWMIHSVPSFPPEPLASEKGPGQTYSYPETGIKYGQSFLCISVRSNQINQIGKQLQYNEAIVYQSNLPTDLAKFFPAVAAVAKKQYVSEAPFERVVDIVTSRGEKFTSFAKGEKWGKDLYKDLVAKTLNVDLAVETWIHEPRRLPSNCTHPEVFNVAALKFDTIYALYSYGFASSVDHSKWAVERFPSQSLYSDFKAFVCVADINRAEPQFQRGGGALCIAQPMLWKHYQALIYRLDKC